MAVNAKAVVCFIGNGPRLLLALAFSQILSACSGSLKDNEALVGLQEETLPPPIEGTGGGEEGTAPLGAESLVFMPATHDFGPVSSAADPVVLQLSLKNISKDAAYVAYLEGEESEHYELRTHDCPVAPLPLKTLASCTITVAFKPTVAGNLNYRVTVPFGPNVDSNSDFTAFASLTGRGVLPIDFEGLLAIDPAKITTTKMTLGWKAAEGAASYAIYDVGAKKDEPLAFVTGETTSYTVTNLVPAKKYTFRVRALNELNEEDDNKVERSADTDAIGSFAALPTFNVAEGNRLDGVDLSDYCTDVEGNVPTFMAINAQSDTAVNCSIGTEPFRVICEPGYKTGHVTWTADVELSCLLNDYPSALTRTLTVSVADTNRAPVVATIANQSVLAGVALTQVDANGPDDQDVDADTLTYVCRYDTGVNGNVSDSALACSTLVNQDASNAAFDPATGVFNWAPRLADAGQNFEFKITASDGTLTGFKLFTVNVGQPPPSPVHSTISVSSPSVQSGSGVTLTLTAKDSAGNNILGGGATVVFGQAGGTSTGTISATTDNGDGTYTATFTGILAGTATNISATVQGSNVTSGNPSLTVLPGAISATKSVVSVAATTVPSGSTVQLTLTAKDAAGNVIPTGGATIAFNRAGGTSTGTISATTDNGNGTYNANFTGVIAGTPTTIGATIGGTAVATMLPTIKVNPGPYSLATSTVALTGSPASIASGSSVVVTLRARDAAGNNLTTGGLSVSFSTAGGTSTGSFGGVTDNADGTYSASFTGQAAGTAISFQATIGGAAVTSPAPSLLVVPGPVSLSNSSVTVASGVLASGASTSLTLTIRDAFGNQHAAGGQTVVFSRLGGTSTGTIATATDNGNGTYSATFTGVVAGTATAIRATIGGSLVTATAPTIQVVPGAISASTSLVSVSAGTVASGANVNLTLVAKDGNGNSLTAGGATIVFNRSGGTSTGTISATTDNANGSYGATFTGIVSGTATTIGATINGVPVTTTLPALVVIPGPISFANSLISVGAGTVTSGTTTTVMLRAKDGNNNNLTSGGRTVVFSHTGGTSTGTFSVVTDNSDGTYSAIFNGVLAGTATTIEATVDSNAVTSGNPTLAVVPGSISAATSVVSLGSGSIASGTTTTATLQAKDANGNNLVAGGSTITFNHSGGTSTATFGGVTDNGNGTYSVTVTGVLAGSTTSVGANIGAAPVTTTKPTLQVVPGPYSLSQSIVTVSGSTIASGGSRTVTARLRDAAGNNVNSGGETVTFSYTGGTSTGTFGSVTDNGDGSYSVAFSGIVAGTATNLHAEVGGSPITSASPTITVVPGPISLAQSLISVSSGTVASGSSRTLTLTAKDANGNSLTTGGQTVVFGRTGGTSTGTISGTTDLNNGSYTASFIGIVAGTATNITATVGGAAVTSGNPTLTVTSGPISVGGSTVAVSSGTVASGANVTLTLTAKDAAGNLVTTGGAIVAFGHAGGTSTGTISGATDNLDGTYTATFTGVVAGSPTTASATIGGAPVSTTMPTIKVNPGAASLGHSLVSVVGSPTTVASGGNVTVRLTAKDANNNTLTSGGSTVSFNFSGGSSTGSFGSVTDVGDGTYTAEFTAAAAGSAIAIEGMIGGSPVTTTLPSFSVVPGAHSLSTSTVTVSGATVLSGGTRTVTLTTRDAFGNALTAGGLTVAFSHTGGTSAGTFGSVTDVGNGTYTATFTGVAAGTATSIRATISGFSVTSAAPTITVNPGAISTATSTIAVSTATVASGTTSTLTLTARDANGNAIVSGGETIVFNRAGGTATGTISATTDNGNGTYTATFTGVNAGTATTVGATIGGNTVTSTLPTITVVPGAISLANSILSVSAATVASGSNVTLTLTAKDVNNNFLTGGGRTVVFSHSGGSSTGTVSAGTDNSNGTYTATFTGVLAGTATSIYATVDGASVTSTSPTISVIPSGISTATSLVTVGAGTLSSGTGITVTLTAKDAAGNNLTAGGSTILFNHTSGTSTGTFGSVTDNGNGTYSATFTGVLSGTATSIGATIGGAPVTTAKPTATVTPGSISVAQSLITRSAGSVASGSNVTLTLTAKDAAGNNVPTGGATVVFTHTGGTSTGAIGATTDVGNGTYTASFTGVAAGTPTSIAATINGSPVTTASPTLTVTPGALSLSQSTITRSAASVASGNSVTLTLTAKDANGNNLTSGGSTVVFGHTGGTSTGNIAATNDVGNGTYTATFTGVVSGTPTSITATAGGSPITSTSPTVTVTVGAISPATSTVSVSSGTIASGSAATVTLTAKDAAGNLIPSGSATIVFNRSGGTSSGSFTGLTDNGDGTYVAQFTGTTAGSATTIGATINTVPVTSTLPTVTVVPGANSQATSTISVSSSTVASGAQITLTLTARDAAANPLGTGGLAVVFNRSGGTSTGTISATTDNLNGTYTATLTGLAAGSATTIGATIDGTPVTSTLPTVTVIPGSYSLSQSLITVAQTNVASGSAVGVTLQLKDANGNNLTAGGATVAFSRTGGTSTGTFGSVSDNGNGTYSANFTGAIAGTPTSINATVNAAPVTSTAPTITVNPGAVSLSQSTVAVSSGSVVSGSDVTLTLRAKDAAGNNHIAGGLTVAFSRSGGTSTGNISAAADNGDGTYTAAFTGLAAGSATTINATIGGSPVTSTMPTVQVTVGSISIATSTVSVSAGTVASGGTVNLTLQAKDANGNNLTSGGAGVVFSRTGGTSTGNVSATTDNGNGTYSATFSALAAGTATTIEATIGGTPLLTAFPTITVTPGAASTSTSLVSVSTGTATSGANVTLTLTAKDANGNNQTAGGLAVVFTHSGGTSTGSITAATDNGNGTYTATFGALIAGSATTINATIGGATVSSTLPTIAVTPGAVSYSQSTVAVSAGTVASGANVTVTVRAKDANGNQLSGGGLTVALSRSGGTSTGNFSAVTDNSNGTYTATFTGVTAGTATTINATVNGNPVTSTLPQVTVNPGALSLAQSLLTSSAGSVASGSNITLTLRAKDANGNNLTSGSETVVFGQSGGTSTGNISATTDVGDGSYTATFTGVVAGTATTIGATVGGSNVTSTLPTIVVTVGSISASASTIAVSSGTVASGSNVTLTLTARDAAGNTIPSGGATVAFNRSGGSSTGTISSTTDNGNGTYTATFTGLVAGTATNIGATINAVPVSSTLPTLQVLPGPVSLAVSTVAVSSGSVASGNNVTVTVTARDGAGNQLTSGGLTVAVNHAGGTSTGGFSGVTDNNNGTYTASFTGVVAGTATTINGTIGGSAITSTMPAVTVNPGTFSLAQSILTVGNGTIVSGNNTSLSLQLKDASGNNLTTGGRTVVFSHTGGTSTGNISATTDVGNGTYTATFTGAVAGTAATIRATVDGSLVTSTLPTITVNIGPASVAQSTVAVSSSTVVSGNNVTLTLTAKDASGNNHVSGGLTVVFNRSGGTSTGNISATTDNGNGTYTATFSGVLAGTATTIGATIGGSAVISTLPTVQVNVGPASPAISTLTASAGSVASGAAVTLTVTAKDVHGNNVGTGGRTVVFSFSGGTATGNVSATTDVGNGTYTATFTGLAAGTATTINATIDGAPITSTLPTVSVTPGAVSLSQSLVTRSAGTVASGSNVSLTLTAKDANGNQLTGGSLTVVFSHTGGTSTGNVSATTDNGNGTYSANFTGVVSGTATTLHATIGGSNVTSTMPTVTVTPGAVSLSQTTVAVGSSIIGSGANTTLTLTARDANGNQLTTGGATVSFSHSGGASTGTISAVTDNNNGTYTATFSGLVAGSATTIGATYNASAVTSTMPTVQVNAGALSLSTSTVSVSTGTIASGGNVTLTFHAKDANSNNILVGGQTVVFSRTGGTSTGAIGATTDNANGTYMATFTGGVAGTATTINATVGGSPVTSTMPTITVIPGAVSLSQSIVNVSSGAVASGSSITVTVRAKDGNGNNITTGGLSVAVSHSGGASTGTFGGVSDNGDGTYTAQFTGIVAGSPTTIEATIGGSNVTSTMPQVTVNVGPVSLSQSSVVVSGSPATIPSGNTANVVLTARDANNNVLTAGGLTVVFSISGGTSTGTFGSVNDNSNGTYSAQFTAQATGTAISVAATIGGAAVTSSLPSFSVVPGTVSLSNSLVSVGLSTLVSGNNTTLTLTTKDAYGNNITTGGRTVVFSRSGGTSTGTISATTDNGNGTYTAQFSGIVAGTATTINASVDGSPVLSTLPTIQVNVGSLSLAASTLSVSTGTVNSGSNVMLTVQAKDANGNNITTGGATIVFSHTGGTSTGNIGSTTDVGNGTYTASFAALTAGSPTTIRATVGGSLLTGSMPSVQVNPGPLSLSQSTIAVSSGTIASSNTSTMTLTIRDANNNVVGVGGQTVVFNRSGGTSTGTISATTDNNNGTYTATFTGVTSGTATTIGATIGGSAVTSTLPTITVTPGSLSLAHSLVTVSSATVASGANATLTLTAKDTNSNTLTTGGLTVVFNRSGGTSTGNIGATTDNNNGTYTATFTGVVSGTPTTIGASIGGSAVTSTLPTLQVDPGTVAVGQSVIEVIGSPGSVASGSTATLRVTAKDGNGNQHTSGGLAIAFSLTGGTSSGTISAVTDNNNGTYTATFTAQAVGTAINVDATINAAAITTPKPSFSVIAGPVSLSNSTVTRGSGTLQSGATTTLTVTARDAYGNTRSGHTIAFNQSGGTSTGTIGSVTDNTNGTYTATFTAVVSGTATTIGATIDGSPITSAYPTITVNPGAISTSQSIVSVSTGSITAGNDVTLTLTARDSNGNLIGAGASIVAFNRSGGVSNGVISGTTDVGNGTYTATFSATVAGAATTIGATIGGVAVTSSLPTITVNPGAVSTAHSTVQVSSGSVAAGGTVNLTMTAKDAYSNQLTGGGLVVAFTKSGGSSDGTITGYNDNGDGTYSAVFNATTIGTARTIGATIGGAPVSTTLPTIAVTIGALSLTNSTINVSAATVASGSSVTMTVTVRDAFNNVFPTGSMAIAFGQSGGTSTGNIGSVTDNSNGTYSAGFVGVVAGTATTISATINGQTVSSAAPTITVVPGPFSLAQSTVTVGHATRVAGTATTLTLTVRDAANNLVGVGGHIVTFAKTAGVSSGMIGAVTDNLDGTYTATFSATTAGSPASIRGTISGGPLTSAQPTITVSPGPVDVSKCTATVTPNVIPLGSTSAILFTARDAFNNQLTSGGATVVFGHIGGQSTGNLDAAIDNINGTYSSVFTGTGQGTATTITVTYNGTPVTNVMPNIAVDPPESSPAFSTVSVSAGTVASGSSITITLTGRDSGNNLVGVGGQIVNFSVSGGTSTGTIVDAPAIDNADGTYTATFIGILAGTATTVAAEIGGVTVSTAMPTITVVPGPLSQLTLSSLPPSGKALQNERMVPQIVVTLKDAAGNVRTGDTSTVVLSLAPGSAGGGLIGATSLAASAGVANFVGQNVGFDTVGNQILRASVGSITADTATIEVVSPVLSISNSGNHLRVGYVAASIATAPVSGDTADTSAIAASMSAIASTTGGSLANTTTGLTSATSAVSFVDVADANNSWTINVDRNHHVEDDCTTMAPLAAVDCTLSTSADDTAFALQFEDIRDATISSSTLQIDDTFVTSNTLPLRKYSITQVTDINPNNDGWINPTNSIHADSDIATQPTNPPVDWMTVFNDKLYFVAYKTGTVARRIFSLEYSGATPVITSRSNTRGGANDDAPRDLAVMGSNLYFVAQNGSNRSKLFSMNTSHAFKEVSNTAGATGTNDVPFGLVPFNNKLFFGSTDSTTAIKLFAFDPSAGANGTIYQVSDIKGAGVTDNIGGMMIDFGGSLYFGANRPASAHQKMHRLNAAETAIDELSNTRGTATTTDNLNVALAAGSTVLLKHQSRNVVYNGEMYFIANQASNATHYKLWKYSGSGNIVQVTNFRTGNTDTPQWMTVFNNKLYFSALDAAGDRELYSIDTSGTLAKVFDLVPSNNDDVQSIGTWDQNDDGTADYLVFSARPNSGGTRKLFIMDTVGYVEQVSDIVTGGNDNPGNGVSWDGDYYFWAHADAQDNVKLFRLRRH